MDRHADITELAQRWSDGDDEALERLIELTYPELRRLAQKQLGREAGDPTINATALVHEAYLKFGQGPQGVWPSRAHFFAFCAKVMRRILIDYARHRNAQKRSGARVRVPLSEVSRAVEEHVIDILQMEEALEFLGARNERMAQVVECRFYGGLTIDETAEALGASRRTIVREWTRARTYLLHLMEPNGTTRSEGDAASRE